MSIKIRCPACGAVHSVHSRALGKKMQCPDCSGPIQVPTLEQIEAAKQAKLARKQAADLGKLASLSVGGDRANQAGTRTAGYSNSLDQLSGVSSGADWATTSGGQNAALGVEEQSKALASALTSFRRPKQPQQEDMDMTPMVDVTFLLLIFFMITASFAVQKSIQRPTQQSDQPSSVVQVNEEDKDAVIIQVDEFNAYNVVIAGADSPAGSKQDLIVRLADFQGKSNPGQRAAKLIVDAHENCIHSAVIDALDAGREAGFETFEVRTVEQFD